MPVNEMHDAVCEAVRKIWAKIERAIFQQTPCNVDARKSFKGRVADVRVSFVVAQQNIKFRFVLLDQIIFKRQCLALVVHHDVFHVRNFSDERTSLRI